MNVISKRAPSLGSTTVAEAKAKVADLRRVAARAVPVESARLNKAADALAAGVELVEKQTAAASNATQPKTASTVEDLTLQLEKAFRGLGLSESQARTAAQGRARR